MLHQPEDKRSGAIRNNFGYCDYGFEQDSYLDKKGNKVYGENYVHIYNLFVYPEFRKQGKAKKILQAAIDAIRKTGYRGTIKIVVDPKEDCISLKKLTSFYKNMGLEVFTYYGI